MIQAVRLGTAKLKQVFQLGQTPAASGPTDHVEIRVPSPQDVARAQRLWPDLASAGLLGSTTSAPIGAALTDVMRGDLLDLLTGLDQAGHRLYATLGPNGMSNADGARPLRPQQALQYIETQPSAFQHPLYVAADGQGRYPVKSLSDLQVLDVLHGAGAAADTSDDKLATTLRGLDGAGFEVLHTVQNGLTWEKVDALAAYRFANWWPGTEARPSRGLAIQTPDGAHLLEETDDPPEVRNLFKCIGQGAGEAFFSGVRQLTDRFYEIGYVDFPVKRPYSGAGSDDMVLLFTPFGLTFPVPVGDLADADAVERQVQVQVAAQSRYLKPFTTEGQMGTSQTRTFTEAMLYGCPELSSEQCATSLAGLIECALQAGFDRERCVAEAGRTLHEIRERVPNKERLHEVVPEVVGLMRSESLQGLSWPQRQQLGLGMAAFLEGKGSGLQAPDRAKVRASVLQLAAICGNVAKTERVFQVLYGEGKEFDERMQTFVETHRRSGDALDPEEVAAIIEARGPDEPLQASADRYSSLRHALSVCKQEDRTLETFRSLHQMAAEEKEMTLQSIHEVFLGSYLHTREVESSLARVREYGRTRGQDPTVERTDRHITFGGVRVPRKTD